MEEDIRKQGMLFHQQQRFGKKWKRVWCVLYRESSCSVSRLEFFEYKDGGNVEKNDKTLRKLQESKKVIRMADCIRVTEVDMDGCPRDTGSFLVETTEKIYVFAVDRNQLDDWTHKLCEIAFPMSWMEAGAKRVTLQRGNKVDEDKEMESNSLYGGQDRVRDFKVCIRRTDAADRCRLKGDGLLRADMEALHLVGKTGDVLYSWPYRYLRRFGRDKSTFSFEAGRRCNSGEGSFEFDTKQGNVLFQTVETAINLQKISLPHRQVSGGVPPEVTQNHLAPGHSRMPLSQPRSQVPPPPAFQAADGVYSMVTEPQSPQMILHRDMDSSNPPQLSQLEPPVDKVLTGVKSLTLDTRGLPDPRKNQVKMISSCPLPSASPEPGSNLTTGPCSNPTPRPKPGSSPNPSQTYSQISMSGVMGRDAKKDKRSINKEPEYSLPFDTIASSVMGDLLLASQQGLGPGGEAGADPLYDSIDEMKIRNIFKSPADSNRKVDHIYDEPEGCAVPSEEQKATPPPSVYDDPEEMRGGAWRCMGTTSDPTGHEYPYNPCVDDYAVPKRAQRAFVSQQSFSKEEVEKEEEEEEDEEEDEEEEEQFSTYDNVMVKMG